MGLTGFQLIYKKKTLAYLKKLPYPSINAGLLQTSCILPLNILYRFLVLLPDNLDFLVLQLVYIISLGLHRFAWDFIVLVD